MDVNTTVVLVISIILCFFLGLFAMAAMTFSPDPHPIETTLSFSGYKSGKVVSLSEPVGAEYTIKMVSNAETLTLKTRIPTLATVLQHTMVSNTVPTVHVTDGVIDGIIGLNNESDARNF